MSNPLIRKLSSFADFSTEDKAALDALCSSRRSYDKHTTLIKEGDRPESVFLLLDGWAYRYKILPDGTRQVLAFLIPGDLCDINIFILKEMDHTIGLLSDAEVASIPKQALLAAMHERPQVAQALFWATLVDEATLREWLVNIGRRDAYESVAHLLCEMWLRMDQVGLVAGNKFKLPVTQEQLGDTVGLTSVHVNRTLQKMRAAGLIAIAGKTLEILDVEGLKSAAGFDPNYLHLERRR